MYQTLARLVTTWPKSVIGFWLVLTVLASLGMANIKVRSDHRVFFSEQNELLIAHDKIEKAFSKNDNVLFVLSHRDGAVLDSGQRLELLSALSELTDKVWYLSRIRRVDSVTNFQHSYAEDDTVVVESLRDPYVDLDAQYADNIIKTAVNEPLLLNRLISPNGAVLGAAAVFNISIEDKTALIPGIIQEVRGVAKAIEESYPNVSVRLTGSLMMDYAFVEASEYDLSVLTTFMLVLMLVVLGFVFRTVVGVMGTLLIIALSICIGVGVGGFLGIDLSPPSLIAPNIILTLAIADCIHLIWGVIRYRSDHEVQDAIEKAVSENARPIILTSVTTAVGFLTLTFSDSPPFNHLGIISAIGVLAAMFLSLSFLPALLMLTGVKHSGKKVRVEALAQFIADFVIRHDKRLLIVGLPFVVIVALCVFKNEINDQYINYFSETIEFRRDTDYAADNLTGMYYIDYRLSAGESGGVSDPRYVQDVEDFANWFRQQPGVLHVYSIADIVKKLNKNFNNENASAYSIPTEKDLISQYMFMYEMSLPRGLDLRDRIDTAKSSTRMTVIVDKLKSGELLDLEARAAEWASKNSRVIGTAQGAGTTIMFSNIGMSNIKSMLVGTFVGLLVISLILTVLFKSLKMGMAVTFTNLMPALTALGAWGLIVSEVGLAVSVLAAMTLGIVVDDTIHFIERFSQGRKQNLSPEDAVRFAFSRSGIALITTSLVLASGFTVLSFSSFQVNSWMGLMTTFTIFIALAIDFLLLPPLLMRIEGRK